MLISAKVIIYNRLLFVLYLQLRISIIESVIRLQLPHGNSRVANPTKPLPDYNSGRE